MVHRVYTPFEPDPKATKRVVHPVAMPDTCHYCGAECRIMHHDAIYGAAYGDWPWLLKCLGCDAAVGLHPGTAIPLGSLASASLRKARSHAKMAFRKMLIVFDKPTAYQWLASNMGLAREACHFGSFNEEECRLAERLCKSYHASRNVMPMPPAPEGIPTKRTKDYIRKRNAAQPSAWRERNA
jgi:hypothetical protein